MCVCNGMQVVVHTARWPEAHTFAGSLNLRKLAVHTIADVERESSPVAPGCQNPLDCFPIHEVRIGNLLLGWTPRRMVVHIPHPLSDPLVIRILLVRHHRLHCHGTGSPARYITFELRRWFAQ